MTQPSFRDIELLSAYLDNQLTPGERARLESRLANDPTLASALQALRQSRSVVRSLPQRRVPRNFTLTPQMAGVKPPLPRSYPFFRLASALAAILFFFTYATNFIAYQAASPLAASQSLGKGGGGGGDANFTPSTEQYGVGGGACENCPTEAPAPTEAPTVAPSSQMPLAPVTETPTFDQSRTLQPPTEFPTETPTPAPASPFAPNNWEAGLLGLAVVSGGAALLVRWNNDRRFDKDKRGK
jgi:hypothetical protein